MVRDGIDVVRQIVRAVRAVADGFEQNGRVLVDDGFLAVVALGVHADGQHANDGTSAKPMMARQIAISTIVKAAVSGRLFVGRNFIGLQGVNRKNRFPAGGEMVTLFVPLLVVTAPP